ncbi:MAG: tetratricopeptide repeat protein [Deltaproteobacteria bacterium]|nr:tetratricopeptide repeat protein [Deltaproteobacteria bacterium]
MRIHARNSKRPVLFITFLICLCLFAGCAKDPAAKDYDRAEELLSQGEYVEALKRYYTITNDFPGSEYAPKSQYKIGIIFNNYFHDRKRAISAFRAVFFVYPNSPEALLAKKELAGIYSNFGDHRKALAEYQWLLKQSTSLDAPEYKFLIAMEYVKMNDFRQARIELDDIIKTTGSMDMIAEAKIEAANTYYLEGDVKTAMEGYDEIIEKFPDHKAAIDAKFNKARALEETGRLAEAQGVLKKLLPDYPYKPVIILKLQSIEQRLKEGED